MNRIFTKSLDLLLAGSVALLLFVLVSPFSSFPEGSGGGLQAQEPLVAKRAPQLRTSMKGGKELPS